MKYRTILAGTCLMAFGVGTAHASLTYDADVTNAVIYGSGNDNGAWTVDRNNGVELGLRAKVRYSLANNTPENTFNSNNDGTYNHAAGAPSANPSRARWNFDWSINSDYVESTDVMLADLNFYLGLDFDPSAGTDFKPAVAGAPDPVNDRACADHAIGTNTSRAAGSPTSCPGEDTEYQNLRENYNLAQNSWNMDFFDDFPNRNFDPNADGRYSFVLSAFDPGDGTELASTSIDVIVGDGATPVPAPAPIALLGIGLMGLGFVSRWTTSSSESLRA